MPGSLPVRRGAQARRKKPVRRASQRMSRVQTWAAAAMVVCLVLAAASILAPAFRLQKLDLEGARFTSSTAVEAVAGIDSGSNAFGFRSDTIAARLLRLPAVEQATVEVRLPSTLVVKLTERQPKLIWTIGSRRYVVDETGLLFGLADEAGRPIASDAGPLPDATASPGATATPAATGSAAASPGPTPSATPRPAPSLRPGAGPLPAPSLAAPRTADQAAPGQGGLGIPVVIDRRSAAAGLQLGDTIDPETADAAYRIGSLTPGDVGSSAPRLVVVIDDTHGVSLTPASGGWVADFGFFTSRRTPDGIPSGARALHSLFDSVGEKKVAWVYLLGDLPGGQNSYVPR